MALADELADLRNFVEELAARVVALEEPEEYESADGETTDDVISDSAVKEWVTAQIALHAGKPRGFRGTVNG